MTCLRRIVPAPQTRENPRMTHTSVDQAIDDLCLRIQGESDQPKLLQLIDQLDAVLGVKAHGETVTREQLSA